MTVSGPSGANTHDAAVMMASGRSRRRSEVLTFLLLTIFLAPIVAIAFVGGYGFLIWIYQIFTGPPGA